MYCMQIDPRRHGGSLPVLSEEEKACGLGDPALAGVGGVPLFRVGGDGTVPLPTADHRRGEQAFVVTRLGRTFLTFVQGKLSQDAAWGFIGDMAAAERYGTFTEAFAVAREFDSTGATIYVKEICSA